MRLRSTSMTWVSTPDAGAGSPAFAGPSVGVVSRARAKPVVSPIR
ncbi:hypothetical protein ABGB17_35905 [Sphaerisporangium sp. B11E5]